MNPFDGSYKRKPSRRTVKRPANRPFGRLALDTSFTRHQGQPPQQVVFPYETRTGDLTFIAFEDIKARLRPDFQDGAKPEEPLRPGPKRSATVVQQETGSQLGTSQPHLMQSRAAALCETTPKLQQRRPSTKRHPFHNRISKLRPSPLDLSLSTRPSARADHSTGFAVTSRFSADTKSPTTAGTQHRSQFISPREDAITPTILITPAEEDFEGSSLERGFFENTRYRPTSSVYSRNTNCMSKITSNGRTPPVPPLPSFASPAPQQDHIFAKPHGRTRAITANSNQSLEDVREDVLPTPRRSRGWWNIITSPFSAPFSARSASAFWRSPSIPEEESEYMPILGNVSAMGSSNPHAGVIFTNRGDDDDELRSAPASELRNMSLDDHFITQQRSNSAPSILGPNKPDFNIYNIPDYGEAAAYFNPHKHFPSLVFSPTVFTESPRELPDGWSPSQSVAHPDKRLSRAVESPGTESHHERNIEMVEANTAEAATKGLDDSASSKSDSVSAPAGPIETDRGIFSSPAEHELKTAEIPQSQPMRNFTQATNDTLMSPLSASPVIARAHVATVVGPQSTFGEQREIEVARSRAPTPSPPALGLGAHTMSHGTTVQEPEATTTAAIVPDEHVVNRPSNHTRQDSYGLGITGTEKSRAISPPELPPAPAITEKSGLVTREHEQMVARSLEEGQGPPRVPWYRRFVWTLISGAAALIMLLVILLVIFVSQSHEDMAVEAQWLQLSGFPAMPTGVATVIQPHNTKSQDQCIAKPSLWSCAAPVQQQIEQPNFRFEIRFRNGTLPSNETFLGNSSRIFNGKRDQHVKSAHARRSTWTDYLYSSRPSPPSQPDQEFLGFTTDNTSTPYDGEETPFWISLLDPTALEPASANIHKRSDKPKNASTSAATDIPKPYTQSNGEPIEQLLYPLATAQPVRLFNRGQDSEHYGFYTYFDRTIYISINGTGASSANATNATVISNVPLANASAVCTWSQTRLLVQLWTRKASVRTATNSSFPTSSSNATLQLPAGNSTANDMRFPGSFPYPVTITVDRHGGAAADKAVYCYGLDASAHTVMEEVKTWVAEDRGVGGTLVNPASVPGTNGTTSGVGKRGDSGDVDTAAVAAGGVDGGSGGCLCQWQNW